jgi:hypothetical protein
MYEPDDPAAPDGELELPDGYVDHPERWTLPDEEALEWALRNLARAERTVDRLKRQRDEAVERIDAYYRDRVAGSQRAVAAMTAAVEAYALAARRAGRNSHQSPYGTVSTRARPLQVNVDREQFLAEYAARDHEVPVEAGYAIEAGQMLDCLRAELPYVRITVEPDARAIREAVTKDGEVLPGVTVTEQEASVTLTPEDVAPFVPNPPPASVVPVDTRPEPEAEHDE